MSEKPINAETEPIPLPPWFEQVFGHNCAEDQETAARLWREEPALRQLVQRLDGLRPPDYKPTACPSCDSARIQRIWMSREVAQYFCPNCACKFLSTKGTPFYRLWPHHHMLLYPVALVLWGPWGAVRAARIAGCADAGKMRKFEERLRPLIEELDVQALTSRPMYRLGFTPEEQGIRCVRCAGDSLRYIARSDPGNPQFRCQECRYTFYLQASRRKFLPIPAGICCPLCEGRDLNQNNMPDSRITYECRDCWIRFVHPLEGK